MITLTRRITSSPASPIKGHGFVYTVSKWTAAELILIEKEIRANAKANPGHTRTIHFRQCHQALLFGIVGSSYIPVLMKVLGDISASTKLNLELVVDYIDVAPSGSYSKEIARTPHGIVTYKAPRYTPWVDEQEMFSLFALDFFDAHKISMPAKDYVYKTDAPPVHFNRPWEWVGSAASLARLFNLETFDVHCTTMVEKNVHYKFKDTLGQLWYVDYPLVSNRDIDQKELLSSPWGHI